MPEGDTLHRIARRWRPRLAGGVEREDVSEIVVCTRAYRAELIRDAALPAHARLARLGPDLLDPDLDLDAALDRACHPSLAHREVANVLLDQRVASGLGNVYKSEGLSLERIHPRTVVGALERTAMRALFTEAARLMTFNLRTRRRTTVPTRRRPTPTSPRLWVYGRAGDPCLDCGTGIESFRQGDRARITYLCPACQPAASEVAPDGRAPLG
ncbi:MAG: hypothetical protein MJB57_11725 [Gemmatimonadetes bacterium]|nr:hypothetical protein [Gemmatimonadota bacterium]